MDRWLDTRWIVRQMDNAIVLQWEGQMDRKRYKQIKLSNDAECRQTCISFLKNKDKKCPKLNINQCCIRSEGLKAKEITNLLFNIKVIFQPLGHI